MSNLTTIPILGSPITALPFETQVSVITNWATKRENHYVCVANVHMLVEAHWHADFAKVLEQADLVTPDGMPLVWLLRLMGMKHQNRVAGLDLFLALCAKAEQNGTSIYFVGSQATILERIRARLMREFPKLQIAGMAPLPFRSLTEQEREELLNNIEASKAGLVFVSLGCPKQEKWMHQNCDRVSAVMLGLGGVFPIYAGLQRRAPRWVRDWGLEWLYRLMQEPGRLWKRYLVTNLVFLGLILRQLLFLGLKQCFLVLEKPDNVGSVHQQHQPADQPSSEMC
jgi:N-acetylglucosaminyldiphosphoundecaprenol N-acetyl-beta-D-mannosaminyltransferase